MQQSWGKPGVDYGTIGDYGASEIGGAYQTLPEASPVFTGLSSTDLKPAGSYDIGYGAPIGEPVLPPVYPVRGLGGWGWKQPIPQPIIAPIQYIAKPVHVPVSIPYGWGWQSPGFF